MINFLVEDIDRSPAESVMKFLFQVNASNATPAVITIKDDPKFVGYLEGTMPEYIIKSIQISPPGRDYTLKMEAAFDNTTFHNYRDDVARTAGDDEIYVELFETKHTFAYPVRFTLIPSGGPEIYDIFLPIGQYGSNTRVE